MEIFKVIEKHPDYLIGDKGTAKSLKFGRERVLKPQVNLKGYLQIVINKRAYTIHQLVAIAFLSHKPNGMNQVIDHIDFNPLNNSVENLQIISNRLNVSKDKKNISGLTGVSWSDSSKKWRGQIYAFGKNFNLGVWESKSRAKIAYDLALYQLYKFRKYA